MCSRDRTTTAATCRLHDLPDSGDGHALGNHSISRPASHIGRNGHGQPWKHRQEPRAHQIHPQHLYSLRRFKTNSQLPLKEYHNRSASSTAFHADLHAGKLTNLPQTTQQTQVTMLAHIYNKRLPGLPEMQMVSTCSQHQTLADASCTVPFGIAESGNSLLVDCQLEGTACSTCLCEMVLARVNEQSAILESGICMMRQAPWASASLFAKSKLLADLAGL